MPNSYDPFGNTASAGRTIEQFFSLQFSTKCGDPGMDLHDYGHRFYSPYLPDIHPAPSPRWCERARHWPGVRPVRFVKRRQK